jgi:hypothetical protein
VWWNSLYDVYACFGLKVVEGKEFLGDRFCEFDFLPFDREVWGVLGFYGYVWMVNAYA